MTRSRKHRRSSSQSAGQAGSGPARSRSAVAGVGYEQRRQPAIHPPDRSHSYTDRRPAYEPEEREYEEQAYQERGYDEQEYAEEEYEEQAAYDDAYETAPGYEDQDAYEYEEEQRYDEWDYSSRARSQQARDRGRRPARPVAAERVPARRPRPRSVAQPRRDPFPIVMGSVIGMLFVGLIVVGSLLLSNAPGSTAGAALPGSVNGAINTGGALGQTAPPTGPQSVAGQATTASGTEPVRMPLADFKALYDDPAKRPLIVDARAKDKYDEGHIKGAVSIPLSEVDGRLAEVPKDKLVVAYCQWPAENESASWARKLINQYGYSPERVKVLLGGWNIWKESNVRDSAAYPVETTTTAQGPSPSLSVSPSKQIVVTVPQGLLTPVVTPTP